MNLKLGGAPVVRRPGGAVLSAPSAGSSGKFSPTSGCRSWPFGEPTIELGGQVQEPYTFKRGESLADHVVKLPVYLRFELRRPLLVFSDEWRSSARRSPVFLLPLLRRSFRFTEFRLPRPAPVGHIPTGTQARFADRRDDLQVHLGHVPTGRDARFELLKNAHSDTRAKAGCSHKAQLLQLVHFAATKSAIEFGLAGFLLMAIQALLHNVPLKRRTAVRPSKPR